MTSAGDKRSSPCAMAGWPAAARGFSERQEIVDLEDSADSAAEEEIAFEFRRKLAALRLLPRHAKPHALRAARDDRSAALKALQLRRARDRQASRMLRRLSMPAPS